MIKNPSSDSSPTKLELQLAHCAEINFKSLKKKMFLISDLQEYTIEKMKKNKRLPSHNRLIKISKIRNINFLRHLKLIKHSVLHNKIHHIYSHRGIYFSKRVEVMALSRRCRGEFLNHLITFEKWNIQKVYKTDT